MMRFAVLFLLFTAIVLGASSARAEDDIKLIGVGAVLSTSPYRGVNNESITVPIIVWDYKNFYVKGDEAGYRALKTDQLELRVFVAPRFMGYHSGDSGDLFGMADRKMSLDGGVGVDMALPWEGLSLGAKVGQDLLARNDGQEAELSLSRELKGEIWQMTPSAGMRVQSGRMTDYYYGVNSQEALGDRQAYKPGAAVNYFADLMFNFGIAKDWIVVTKADVEALSPQISKSPIVEEDFMVSGTVGLARRF